MKGRPLPKKVLKPGPKRARKDDRTPDPNADRGLIEVWGRNKPDSKTETQAKKTEAALKRFDDRKIDRIRREKLRELDRRIEDRKKRLEDKD